MQSAGIIKFKTGRTVLFPLNRVKDSPSYASDPYLIEQNIADIDLAGKLLEVLNYSLDDAPEPPDWKEISKNHLKAIGVGTMKELHTDSIYVIIFTKEGNYYISPTINMGSRKGFQGVKNRIIIPLSSSMEDLSKALKEAINTCS